MDYGIDRPAELAVEATARPAAKNYTLGEGVFALFCLAVGLLITKKRPRSMSQKAKEGFVTVALCWVVLSALGALPFVISRVIPSYVDALFEVVSGFTTTGSSILPEVEHMPHCLLFWRSFTHWIGGMGVLVFCDGGTSACRRHEHVHDESREPGTVGRQARTARKKHGGAALWHVYWAESAAACLFAVWSDAAF